MNISVSEILSATGGRLISGSRDALISHAASDTKNVKSGSIFVPIIGARVDGHTFIEKAVADGAVAAFTSEDLSDERLERLSDTGAAIIRVEDTRTALQETAKYYRRKYINIPYIGVTGSVGKTTTREMIACALSAGLNTYSTKGNANSQIGVPITVTETNEDAEIGVIEMGISEHGEMSRLAEIVNCSMAVMTVIGVSHIANLGSRENIMLEKLHITDCLPDDGGLILNGDDELLKDITLEGLHELGYCHGKHINIIFYGTGDKADYRAQNVIMTKEGAEYELVHDGKKLTDVKLSVSGMHMVLNSLAALAAAAERGVDIKKAAERLHSFKSLDGRGQLTEKDGIKIINDAYNAAPQSMEAGLRVLDEALPEGNGEQIAVLADMLELGKDEAVYHAELGDFIANNTKNISTVLMYGDLCRNTFERIRELADIKGTIFSEKPEAKAVGGDAQDAIKITTEFNGRILTAMHFDNLNELKKELCRIKKNGDVIFFKGSNSMKLWSLAAELINE